MEERSHVGEAVGLSVGAIAAGAIFLPLLASGPVGWAMLFGWMGAGALVGGTVGTAIDGPNGRKKD